MAKATAICTCKVCGTNFKKEKECFNRQQANDWELWAVKNYNVCPSCWRDQRNEDTITNGIHYDTYLFLYGILESCYKNDLAIVFDKNSYAVKDKLKKAGAEYIDGRWVLFCDFDNYENIVEDLKQIPAIKDAEPRKKDIEFFKSLRQKKEDALKAIVSEKKERLSKINNVILPEEIQEQLSNGAKWNGKIYGNGDWSIYLNGKAIHISDDTKSALITLQQNKNVKQAINDDVNKKISEIDDIIKKDVEDYARYHLMDNWQIYDHISAETKPNKRK